MIKTVGEKDRSLYNKLATHPLQSWEWGAFRKNSGNSVYRFANFNKENEITGRTELYRIDIGLYKALGTRKLFDKIMFDEKQRNWAAMSDDELVQYAQKEIDEKGIKNRGGLEKEDLGLYAVLLRRKDSQGKKLLDKLEFEERRRDWASMSNEELVEHAQKKIDERSIKSRRGLEKEDQKLYYVVLRRKDSQGRKLVDLVFLDIEKSKQKEAAQDLLDGLAAFGEAA